ncbi:hypothetical protein BOH72_20990 [Mycobacterium sp. WY10]|nr:hypothetical protein BOH72_20990 [Mycobacterium sp. WY10]
MKGSSKYMTFRVVLLVAVGILLTACGGSADKYSSDPVLQKAATKACQNADGMPNLGVNFNWSHNLSGDFNPSFSDEGTFDWGIYKNQPQKSYKFTCTGRFDDDHQNASAVLENLTKVKK